MPDEDNNFAGSLVLDFTEKMMTSRATRGRDEVCDSRCMTGTCDPFKMLCFSVMQSTFCFCNVKFLAVPTTSLINNF